MLDASDGLTVLAAYNATVILQDRTPPKIKESAFKPEIVKCAASGATSVVFTQAEMLSSVFRRFNDVDDPACFGTAGDVKLYLGIPGNGGSLLTSDQIVSVGNSLVVTAVVKDYAGNTYAPFFLLKVADPTCNVVTTINFTATPAAASCGGNNGTISITGVSGGAAPYFYSSNGGGSFGPPIIFSGMAPGSYSIVVRDNNGVQTSKVVVVTTSGTPTVIVSQPASVAVCAGSAASFSVTATGAGPLSYQWRKDRINIGGATGPTYAIPSVNNLNAGSYEVVITSACGPVTSDPATLTANAGVTIGVQPKSQTVCAGDRIGLVVIANGSGLTYQWRKNGVNIPRATKATFFIDVANRADTGLYDVRVEGVGCKTSQSEAAFIIVNEPAAIAPLGQPQGSSACIGSKVTFSVTATGTSLKYKWRKGLIDIPNATNATYSINSALPTDFGNYFVKVTAACGASIDSNPAGLAVVSGANITKQPQATQTVCEGQKVDLTVEATGASLSYQWLKTSSAGVPVPVPGATNAIYSIPAAVPTSAGSYQVKVAASCGLPVTSFGATLIVNSATAITTPPASQSVCAGSPVTFVVVAKGTSVNYQWRKVNARIDGATGSSFNIPAVSAADGGDYEVIVSGACGTATSQKATLTVNTPVVILKQLPLKSEFCEGSKLEISVTASGSGLRYQWFRNGPALAGETNASFSVASALSASGGFYSVTVSDACGNITTSPSTSAVSLVVVNKPVAISASTASPANGTVCEGLPASFQVTATGTALKYQWRKDANPITGATNAIYPIAAAALADAGIYDVVVTGTCGPKTNTPPPLVVNSKVALKTQPIAQTVCVGADVSFTVSATGTGLAYQWSKDKVAIPTATGPVLSLAKVGDADAGSYEVVITGACGTLTNSAALKVGQLVASITAEGSTKICPGGTVKLTATAGASYSWSNGSTLQSILAIEAGSYSVTVKDANGCSATSDPVVIEVKDVLPPVARCKPLAVSFSDSPLITIKPEQVDDGSSDDCGIVLKTLSKTTFGPGDIGENKVTLTVADAAGRTSSCETIVTVTLPSEETLLYVGDVTETEGNDGKRVLKFVVELSAPMPVPVTVDYSTQNGTALSGADYEAADGTLVFAPGEVRQEIAVNIAGDSLNEGNEQFSLQLTNPHFAKIGRGAALGTIADDDLLPAVTINDMRLNEGNAAGGEAVLTVALSTPSGVPVTVDFATEDGTAHAGEDFEASQGRITFAPGIILARVAVATVSRPSALLIPKLSIAIKDGKPVITWQGDSGAFELQASSDAGSSTSWAAVAGKIETSGALQVYQLDASGPLLFYRLQPNSGTGPRQQFTVRVKGDSTHERDETFGVRLQKPTNALIAKDQGLVTIVNDDPQPTLTIQGVTLAEGDDGFTNAVFKVTLSGSTALPAEVDYATVDGTAKAGTDFEAASGRLTFAPGETVKTIAVRINSDRAFEPDEDFLVRLSNPLDASIQSSEATGLILNDDLVPVLTIADVGLLEGDSGPQTVVMPVQLSRPTGQAVTVKWATINGTALSPSDYIAAFGELTFAPGETGKNIELIINGDVLSESDETFFVRLAEPVNATLDNEKGGVAVVAIVDDDSLPVLSIASAQVSVTEGDTGLQTATIIVQLSKTSGQAVAVKWSTADGTALAASDYIVASGDLAFAPGETSQSFSVFVRGDVLNEPNETFSVNLESPANATIDKDKARAVVTIVNDDVPPVVTITDVQVVEGNSGTQPATLTLQLSRASAQQVSVKWTATDGTALAGSDYIAASGEAIFAPGETSKSIVVLVNGDTVSEPDELFTVNLTSAINATVGQANATVKIVNDDQATVLNILNASLTEGDSGTQTATLVVQLSQASGLPVTVKWATSDISAIAGSDYVTASGTLAFAPGETSKTITVSVNGDTLNEADEDFAVNLSSPTNATLGISKGVVTIINNDPLPALSVADASVTEGNTGTQIVTVPVQLSKTSGRTVTVRWATADDTALAASDYLASGGDLTFAPGETVKNITVTVRGDTLNELDETFAVDLSVPVSATLDKGRGFVKIVNDDAPPELRMGDVGILEGDAGTRTATLSVTLLPGSALPVTVKWATADGTAVAPSDYVTALGDLTFAPGETNKLITLTVKGDILNEPDETFSVNLSSPVPSNTVIKKPRGVVAIINDDPVPELSITGVRVTEGDVGTLAGVLSVQLSKISGQTVTVKWATADGTALAATDYVAASADLTFAPGETSKSITVSIKGDTVTETDETFTVNLTGSVNATISNAKAVGVVTIVDNEKPNLPPLAAITSPEEEDSFLAGMSISLAVLASDIDGKITKIEFMANGLAVGAATVEPFAVTWANIVAGTYEITAVATDDRGAKVTSVPVHITVRATDGRRRVAIVQGSADPEITKMQSYLGDMDLISQPFRRDAITFENLKLFDLVIWDDIGAGANTVTAAEVTLLKRLYDAEIPLYFVGSDLARQGTTLAGASRTAWSNLLRLNPATTAPPVGGAVNLVDSQDPVSNGPFGLVGDFKMPAGFDVTSALGTGENVIARAAGVPVVLAAEDSTLIERTVTQTMFVFAGENLNSRVQREKLFKNAVWWLLQLPPPPPFLNLSLAIDAQPGTIAVGQLVTVTLTVNHGGELEASGITVTLDVPTGLEFVSATSAAGPCVEEDGVVVGQLGRLSRSGVATATVVLRAKTVGAYQLHGSVSGNQPEPSTRENDADAALSVTP